MKLLLFGALILCLIVPILRCALFNIHKVTFYSIKDLFLYFKQKKFNLYGRTGQFVAYTGLFGKGKTLSAVAMICGVYNKFNDKIVWSDRRKKFVKQKIRILSNVSLAVPYQDLTSLKQVVEDCEHKTSIDDELDVQTVTLVLIDEASVLLNCRSFKDNINSQLLNKLLTCRHYMLSIFWTSQRFKQTDKAFRDVTQAVIDCDKLWRFQRQYLYDAWDMENATDMTKIKPVRTKCWFVTNKHYQLYNTLACVDNLIKSWQEGDMLNDEEYLQTLGDTTGNNEAVYNPSRLLIKQRKHK